MKPNDDSTKLRIIHTAKKLFAQYNFDYVSTRMIAAEANIGQSAIFFHFGSKENLCAAVIEDILKYHKIYYAPIAQKIKDTYAAGNMDKEQALQLIEEILHTQIKVAFDPQNRSALSFSVNGRTLPYDIIKPLYDDIRESIELPMARLLCSYHGSSDLSGAYTVCHAANVGLMAFAFVSSLNIMQDIKAVGCYQETSDIKDMLFRYMRSSLINAPLSPAN